MARKSGKDRGIVEKPAGSGKWWLRFFERPKIKTWVASLLGKGLTFGTAKNTLLTLSNILTEALEDGLIQQNPALRSVNWE